MDLDDKRKQIDEIDEQLAIFFEKRMELVADICKIKQGMGRPVTDSTRERDMFIKNVKHIKNKEMQPHYENFLKSCLQISKDYQQQIIIKKF